MDVLNAAEIVAGGGLANPTQVSISHGTGQRLWSLGGGLWYSTGVPYFRPDVAGEGILDVLANGPGKDSWIDIGSDWTTQADGEFLELRKIASGAGTITVKGLSGGTPRPLILQPTTASTDVKIGFNKTPTEQYHFGIDLNGAVTMAHENASNGTGAYAVIEVRNGTSTGDGTRIGTMGTGFTTNGAFVQDGGILETGANLAGGLSILTRNASGNIRFYTGGFAAGNLAATIFTDRSFGLVDGITAPSATVGFAKLFVDTADGDLKVIFGDGTVKTISTDT